MAATLGAPLQPPDGWSLVEPAIYRSSSELITTAATTATATSATTSAATGTTTAGAGATATS